MIQEIIVGLILLAVILIIGRKIYLFFIHPEQANPCAGCSKSCSLRQEMPCNQSAQKKKCALKQENGAKPL